MEPIVGTQGARLSFLQGDNELPGWLKTGLDNVPALGFAPEADRVGYELGQSIFTPANTHTSNFLPDDRPYARLALCRCAFAAART